MLADEGRPVTVDIERILRYRRNLEHCRGLYVVIGTRQLTCFRAFPAWRCPRPDATIIKQDNNIAGRESVTVTYVIDRVIPLSFNSSQHHVPSLIIAQSHHFSFVPSQNNARSQTTSRSSSEHRQAYKVPTIISATHCTFNIPYSPPVFFILTNYRPLNV